jgi:hypothetical protein
MTDYFDDRTEVKCECGVVLIEYEVLEFGDTMTGDATTGWTDASPTLVQIKPADDLVMQLRTGVELEEGTDAVLWVSHSPNHAAVYVSLKKGSALFLESIEVDPDDIVGVG